jgi:hypothetical protein
MATRNSGGEFRLSDRIVRRLPVVQNRGDYSGKWYPHIVRHGDRDYVVVEEDYWPKQLLRLASAEDYANNDSGR